jgi:chaperone modulatory protein CbpM
MTQPLQTVQVLIDECWLDTAQLCRLAGVSEAWLHERVMLGVLQVHAHDGPDAWRFDAAGLRRVQRLAGLERDFDAVPELAALVADLEHELAQLRALLRRRGVP